MIDAQLPRYGKKTCPWIGTTGAGQNCPEGESESPGEDMIFEDRGSVLNFFPVHYRIISDMRRGIQGSLVQFTVTVRQCAKTSICRSVAPSIQEKMFC
jgi:hypothetical protein